MIGQDYPFKPQNIYDYRHCLHHIVLDEEVEYPPGSGDFWWKHDLSDLVGRINRRFSGCGDS